MSVRNNPFARNASTSPAPSPIGRPKSALFSSSPSPLPGVPAPNPLSHSRSQSHISPAPGGVLPGAVRHSTVNGNGSSNGHTRELSRSATTASSTFAPSFIKTEDMRKPTDVVKGIEGENDFSGKKYVWLKDPQAAFVKGWVVEELEENRILVQCDDGSVSGPFCGSPVTLLYSRFATATGGRCRECRQGQPRQVRQG